MTQMCQFVADVLGVEHGEISPDTGPGMITKWDSLAHIQIVAAIEETYEVQLTTEEIISLFSVKDIVSLLQEKGVSVD